ncbi:MAG: hypothetical protein WDA71_10865 [Actinomycetota bacterium]
MGVKVGFVLALVGAIASNTGLALLKRGADQVSRLTLRPSWSVIREFTRCRIWLLGTFLQVVSFGFYLGALSLVPVSVVQPVISSGILVLVFLATWYLRERTSLVEKVFIGFVIAGLPILGVSLESSGESATPVASLKLALFSLAALAGVALLIGVMRKTSAGVDWGVGLGLVSGVFGGCAMLTQKGLTAVVGRDGLLSLGALAYVVATALTNLGFYALLQAAFQRGRAMTVVPAMGGVSSVLPVLGGFWVFGETLPAGWRMAARIAGTLLIIAGSVGLSRFGGASGTAPGPPPEALAGSTASAERTARL